MNGSLAENHKNGEYTYEDYLSWEGDERWEIIDGWAYMMAAPNEEHHDISWALSLKFDSYFKGKPCKPYAAPFEVRLFPHNRRQREQGLVQPDLFVVCDRGKSDGARINGAPDLVVEILSPSNAGHDRYRKSKLYKQAGVREYWIVDPADKVVQVYSLEHNRYVVSLFEQSDILTCAIFPGLEISLSDIFPNE